MASLYDVLHKQLLKSDYIQVDGSPIGVQDSHKKVAMHEWVYRSLIKRLVLFKYHPSRQQKAMENMLSDFSGSLQTDIYQAYQNMRI